MNNQIQLVLKSSTTELSLNDRELGIYLTPELDGLTGLPEIRTTSGVNAGYDGGWTSAQNYDARSITIRGVIANEDVATVEQLRRQLTTLAGQGKNEELTLDLVTQAGKAYTIQVRTIALEMSLQKVLTQQEFMLQLRADDPLIYDASETGHEALLQVAQATGGFTIDFELPLAITGSSEETVVNNEGLEQVPTITRMYGALHNPKIINQTTNQFMQIEADLGFAEGDWIEPSEVVSGKDITINDAPEGAPLSSVKIDGNTTQQTYSGKNLLRPYSGLGTITPNGLSVTLNRDGSLTISGTANAETYIEFGYQFYGATQRQDNALYDIDSASTYRLSATYSGTITGGSYLPRVYAQIKSDYTEVSSAINSSATITGSNGIYRSWIRIYNGTSFTNAIIYPQLELGNTATAWQPYVGGIPAPNPDYPQAVQTVTGENVVKIHGKNLNEWENATWSSSTTAASWCFQDGATGAYGSNITSKTAYKITLPAGTYTAKVHDLSSNVVHIQVCTDGTPNEVVITIPANINSGNLSSTITLTETATVVVRYRVTNPSLGIGNTKLQIEKGSATAYEPYQGQSYPISLGSIELCKIGDYQDYIYKSGDKWYVHKETGKRTYTADDITIAASDTYSNVRYAQFSKGADNKQYGNYTYGDIINFFTNGINMGAVPAGGWNSYISDGLIYNSAMQDNYWCSFSKSTDLATMKAKLDGMAAYYALATPTDTEITNEALIAQLEALAAATMYNPQTNITTLYADGNEQPTLDVSYFTDKNPDTRDELVIDSRLRTITLNGLDVYHLQAPGSEFLMLAPGENRLSLQSDITGDNGYAQVSYKQGYLSI